MTEFEWNKGKELTDNEPGKWIIVGWGHYEVFKSLTDAFIEFAVVSTPEKDTDSRDLCILQHYSPRQWIIHKCSSSWFNGRPPSFE